MLLLYSNIRHWICINFKWNRMSLGATTLSKTIFTIMTLSIMTLGIKGVLPVEHKHSAQKCNPIMLSVTLYFCHAECRYAERHYAECRYAECRCDCLCVVQKHWWRSCWGYACRPALIPHYQQKYKQTSLLHYPEVKRVKIVIELTSEEAYPFKERFHYFCKKTFFFFSKIF